MGCAREATVSREPSRAGRCEGGRGAVSGWDWLIVAVFNGGIILAGLWVARGTRSSFEWFLASRTLPWWAIGLSMFATNVDSADLVGVTAMTFREGVHVVTVYALGSAVGAFLAAWVVVPQIVRAGCFTNAEYLEWRYGPSTRVLSALIQIQYRTSLLGAMIWSTYQALLELVGLSAVGAWVVIVGLVVAAAVYTSWGGLKSVVWTDAGQGVVMIIAAAVVFTAVWDQVGGWKALEAKLHAQDVQAGTHLASLLHVGGYHGDRGRLAAGWIVLGWTIIGAGYWTVNHTQTMRLMGARSLRDMQYGAVFGVLLSLPVMLVAASLGVFCHGMDGLPELDPDRLFPYLANHVLRPGLKGLVVAGMVAALVSTFDSMGSALSAVFTRDVYARFIASNRSESHYVLISRVSTVGILLLGFAYVPFIARQDHMLRAFVTLIPVFVTPLLTVYVAGVTTKVSRRSGLVGLLSGGAYGVLALIDRQFVDWPWFPAWLSERWVAIAWSVLFTLVPMAVATLIQRHAGRNRTARQPAVAERVSDVTDRARAAADAAASDWLSRTSIPAMAVGDESLGGVWGPRLAAAVMFALCVWVNFGLLW
ncbi:MAG: hypothetical protein D6725_06920 [Planctomycetota bacterium]|nr:MAG: hypothetical protein D6725_06920 [Planctomycetota bacterium]